MPRTVDDASRPRALLLLGRPPMATMLQAAQRSSCGPGQSGSLALYIRTTNGQLNYRILNPTTRLPTNCPINQPLYASMNSPSRSNSLRGPISHGGGPVRSNSLRTHAARSVSNPMACPSMGSSPLRTPPPSPSRTPTTTPTRKGRARTQTAHTPIGPIVAPSLLPPGSIAFKACKDGMVRTYVPPMPECPGVQYLPQRPYNPERDGAGLPPCGIEVTDLPYDLFGDAQRVVSLGKNTERGVYLFAPQTPETIQHELPMPFPEIDVCLVVRPYSYFRLFPV